MRLQLDKRELVKTALIIWSFWTVFWVYFSYSKNTYICCNGHFSCESGSAGSQLDFFCHLFWMVGWLEFNVPCQHKYGHIRDELVLRQNQRG